MAPKGWTVFAMENPTFMSIPYRVYSDWNKTVQIPFGRFRLKGADTADLTFHSPGKLSTRTTHTRSTVRCGAGTVGAEGFRGQEEDTWP